MNNYKYICGGCGKEYEDLNDLNGLERKTCSSCDFSLFMVIDKELHMDDFYVEPELDDSQAEVFYFIKNYYDEHSAYPSVADIQRMLSIKSVSTVYYHLNSLKKKGFITFKQGSLNSLRLLPKAIEDEYLLYLTDRQIFLLKVIHEYIEENGESPTNQELQSMLGFKSIATLAYHLSKLQELGLINKSRYQHRSISITPKGEKIILKSNKGIRGHDT